VLIGITGPIASGKSAIARAVAHELGRGGMRTAVIDLDLLYDMLDDRVGVGKRDEATWQIVRAAAGALSDALFAAGIEVVVVDGDLFTEERNEYLTALTNPVDSYFVTLWVSYAGALHRATADPSRGISRDADFLRGHFTAVERRLTEVPASDLVIDTERSSVEEAAGRIIAFAGLARASSSTFT
jgi:adenylylsulfate kinase-like enzyme